VDYDPRMEARIANIEAHLARIDVAIEYMQRDIKEIKQDLRAFRAEVKIELRILFGALFTVPLGLAGIMAKGFDWL
jgi:hypothetical protein